MPPKPKAPTGKAPSGKGAAQPVVEVPHCGLFVEMAHLPLWDDAENEKEVWGDLTATGHVDASTLFVDPDWTSPSVATLNQWIGDWRRPSAIFSPFKPVVYRPSMNVNPYEWDPSKVPQSEALAPSFNNNGEEDDQPELTHRAEILAYYRHMKTVRMAAGEDGGDGTGAGSHHVPSGSSPGVRRHTHHAKKPGKAAQAQTPLFMRILNSALMVLNQNSHLLPQGQYAWELIYPQQAATGFPLYNPTGKYAVKLFIGGAFRRIVVDDRLPVDLAGQCMLTVTEQKEVWPAIIAKAIMKALGPTHEQLLFKNPVWVVSTVMCGFQPQVLSPLKDELMTLRALRQTMAGRAMNEGQLGDPILIATCGDATKQECPLPEGQTDELIASNAGFHPNQAFHLLDMRPYSNTSLIRLCAPNAAWKGPFHYGSNSWSDVEQVLGFTVADRNPNDLLKKWNDFWIPWEQFTKYFSSIVVLRSAAEKSYPFSRTMTCPPDPVIPEAKAPGGKGQPPPPTAEQLAAIASRGMPKNVTKWLHINSEQPTMLLLAVIGLPKPKEKDGEVVPFPDTTVTIHKYNWKASCPFGFISKMSVENNVGQSLQLLINPGVSVYKIQVEGLPMDGALSIMSPGPEFTLGDEKEICKDLLEVATTSDAGIYQECKPDFTTIWFKRHITIKQPTRCNLFLSTLAKGTDLAQFKSGPADPAPGGKGKAAAKPAKPAGKADAKNAAAAADAEANLQEEIDDGSGHEFPIMQFANLTVVNMDTGAVVATDTIGKVLGLELQPNKTGYCIVATASPTEAYGKGLWRLLCTSDRPFETFESRAFEEIISKTGEYLHNDHSSLLRYNFTVGEPATASIQLRVMENFGIPFKFQLFHNEKEIDCRQGKGYSFIHHMQLAPAPDKNTPSVYAVHCTLDSSYTKTWEEQRREHVVLRYAKDCEEQEVQLLEQQQLMKANLKENPEFYSQANASTTPGLESVGSPQKEQQTPAATDASPGSPTQRPGSVAAAKTEIAYTLTVATSSTKLDVKEDNSIAEHLTAVKASWSKPKDDHEKDPKEAKKAPPKPNKNQPVVDEAAVRFAKAKESRERFLANRKGVFMPHFTEGKLYLNAEDDPKARMVPMSTAQPFDAQARNHNGVGLNGGAIHGGVKGSEELTAKQEAEAAAAAALVRPAMREVVESLQGQCATQRDARKQLALDFQEAITTLTGAKPEVNQNADVESGMGKKSQRKK